MGVKRSGTRGRDLGMRAHTASSEELLRWKYDHSNYGKDTGAPGGESIGRIGNEPGTARVQNRDLLVNGGLGRRVDTTGERRVRLMFLYRGSV